MEKFGDLMGVGSYEENGFKHRVHKDRAEEFTEKSSESPERAQVHGEGRDRVRCAQRITVQGDRGGLGKKRK